MKRSDEQQRIIDENTDRKLLLEAMKTFGGKLEQIRLMRCEDTIEVAWHRFASSIPDLTMESKSSRWARACEHASTTLAKAFNESDCNPRRLSGRALDPRTSLLLANNLQKTGPRIAMRLTCLELQFDDRANLDEEIAELSEHFQQGFSAAVNVQGLHIGFYRPVSIPFETVFHNVYWEHLRYIGFGAWRLHSQDVIGFVRRHKRTLKSIRLRGVLLYEGSSWLDIIKVLRLELKLKWVSFRGVGYSGQETQGAIFVSDDDFEDDSDGSEDFAETEDDDSPSSDEDAGSRTHGANRETTETEENGWSEEGEGDEGDILEDNDEIENFHVPTQGHEAGEENAVLSYENTDDETDGSVIGNERADSEPREPVDDLPPDDHTMMRHANPGPDHQLQCSCGNGFAWADLRLADDHGRNPTTDTWKWWQKWVVNRCPTHDAAASELW